jgi:hypothetical protein
MPSFCRFCFLKKPSDPHLGAALFPGRTFSCYSREFFPNTWEAALGELRLVWHPAADASKLHQLKTEPRSAKFDSGAEREQVGRTRPIQRDQFRLNSRWLLACGKTVIHSPDEVCPQLYKGK